MRPAPGKVYFTVAALIRVRSDGAGDDELLLVQQKGPGYDNAYWTLPGGRVARGELLMAGLLREVREETGLEIVELGQLIYTARLDNPQHGYQAHTRVFAVQGWRGELSPADPERLILDVAFVPLPEARHRLAQMPWLVMRQPLLAYLQGEAAPGCVWLYDQRGDEAPTLITRQQGPALA